MPRSSHHAQPDMDYAYADALEGGRPKGRGAGLNPANRHQNLRLHVLGQQFDPPQPHPHPPPHPPPHAPPHAAEEDREDEAEPEDAFEDHPCSQVNTDVLADRTRRIINRVQSPDINFKWTVNPYRGCEHGCIYCYARPDHERLGYSSGLDFETKIMAKHEAPTLLRRELAHPRWAGEPIVFSGVTDCYQPIERKLRITRGCLEVCAQANQPISVVTKSRLITRDLDLLGPLAEKQAVHACVSLTTLDPKLAAKMEPRAASPRDRLRTIGRLSQAGVPVTVMAAPMIPAINDRELPSILEAAADAGATSAGYVLLRLPHQLKALFIDWLQRHFPDRAEHVESLIRQSREGALYDPTPGKRRRGAGPLADQLRTLFEVYAKRHGLTRHGPSLNTTAFRRPQIAGQGTLF